MDMGSQKEQFSIAYARAVASVAGYAAAKFDVDDDSVDLSLAERGGKGTVRSPRLDLQLKCTEQDIMRDDHLAFALGIKNYDDLRPENVLVPRILVVVLVPDRVDDWLAQSEEELALRRCGYWVSLRGMPGTNNSTSVTIDIPRSQMFTPAVLRDIMERVGNGGAP